MSRKLFRRFVLFALLAAVLSAGLPAFAPAARASSGSVEDGENDYVRNELNLKLFNAADIDALASQYKLEKVEQFGRRPIFLLRLTAQSPAGLDSKALAARILAENTTKVEMAEPNYTSGSPEG